MYSVPLHVVFASEDVVSIHRLNVVFDDPPYSCLFGLLLDGYNEIWRYLLAYLHYSYCSDWISKIDLDTTWWDPSDPMGLGMRLMLVLWVMFPMMCVFPFFRAGVLLHVGAARSGAIPHKLDWIKGWDGSTLVVPLGPHRKKEGSPHEQRSGKI